jgi:hypothetical protein
MSRLHAVGQLAERARDLARAATHQPMDRDAVPHGVLKDGPLRDVRLPRDAVAD